ncbi:MAG: SDR family oxidoreductase [Bacteroidales bacterium]|nr:SDR family oxidoreductase [Bacteroidales bacterium]
MKVILVTGGNRGIGLEICRQLDSMGHTVIMGSRYPEDGLEAAAGIKGNITVHRLDVTDEESIRVLKESVKAGYGRLDVLVNNAAVGAMADMKEISSWKGARNFIDKNMKGLGRMVRTATPFLRRTGIMPPKANAANVSLDAVRGILDVNLFGAWRMIQVFLPLLEKSPEGRIINVSSSSGELKSLSGEYPGYSLSKASLNALTIMFSNELRGKGIKVNAMCPGWVRTDMGGPTAPRDVAQGADTAVWLATCSQIPTGKFFRDRKEIEW